MYGVIAGLVVNGGDVPSRGDPAPTPFPSSTLYRLRRYPGLLTAGAIDEPVGVAAPDRFDVLATSAPKTPAALRADSGREADVRKGMFNESEGFFLLCL